MDTEDNLIKWSKGERPGPFKLQLNPTDRCNLKCVFCWQRDEAMVNYIGELSEKRYLELIDEAEDLGVKHVEITGGGEPTSRKNLVLSLMEKIKEKDMTGSMITNGTLFLKRDFERIVKSGWDELIVSLDGLKENHDYLRAVKGSFDKTFNNLYLLQETKKKYNSIYPKLSIHFVLTNINYKDIPSLIESVNSLGIKNFFIEPLVQVAFNIDVGERLKIRREHHKELNEILKEAKKICTKNSIENNIESFATKDLIENTNKMNFLIKKRFTEKKEKHPLLNFPCYEPWYHVVVRPNGKAGPCCMFDVSDVSLADMTLKEVWESNYFRRVRKDLSEGNLNGFCSKCNPSLVSNTEKIKKELKKRL
jgi:MoaA/NifB/PqqE/SkfB family radical SAM enzyme